MSEASSLGAAARVGAPGFEKATFHALTGLRFVLALRVLTRHWVSAYPTVLPWWLDGVVNHGAISVSGFFVLSGFVMSYRYMDERRAGRLDARTFWVDRIARLYPIYALGLLLALPTLFGFWLESGADLLAAAQTGLVAASVLTLTQAWFPQAACVWNCQGWSLSATVFFLVLFPLVAVHAMGWRPSRLIGVALALWALALVAPFAFSAVSFDSTHAEELTWNTVMWNPMLRLPEFLLGMAAGRVFILRRAVALRSRLGHPLVGIGALAAIILLLSVPLGIPEAALKSMAAPLLALLVYSLASGVGPLAQALGSRPMQILGAASFALYILHLAVADALMFVFRTWGVASGQTWLFFVDAGLATGLAVWVSHRFERPASAWVQARIPARLRGARAAVAETPPASAT